MQASFAGKFAFCSTTSGPVRYLTGATNPGDPAIYPEIAGLSLGPAETAILYTRPDGTVIVVLAVPGKPGEPVTLAYLRDQSQLGFVTTDPDPANAAPLRIAPLGSQAGMWSILDTGSNGWTPLTYTVGSEQALLVYSTTGTSLAAEPVTPGYTALVQSKQGQKADLRYCDLTGLDLSGVNFTGADFTRANLTNTKLHGATLTACLFTDAVMTETDLTGATLDRATLSGLNLCSVIWGPGLSAPGAHFESSLMSGCKIRTSGAKADFSGAFFTGADLGGADFSNTDLSAATFHGANMTGTMLSSADLTGAHLGGTSADIPATLAYALMSNVILTGANLFGVNFTFATLYGAESQVNNALTIEAADFSNAYLEGISFQQSNLQGARFDGACLIGADFTGATLGASAANSMPASFVGACLPGAIFTGASIAGANFANAALSFGDGAFQVRYCTKVGPMPPPPILEPVNCGPTTGLDLTTLQPSTICPNGTTLAANQARGLSLQAMLTGPGAPTQWIAASCMVPAPAETSPGK